MKFQAEEAKQLKPPVKLTGGQVKRQSSRVKRVDKKVDAGQGKMCRLKLSMREMNNFIILFEGERYTPNSFPMGKMIQVLTPDKSGIIHTILFARTFDEASRWYLFNYTDLSYLIRRTYE